MFVLLASIFLLSAGSGVGLAFVPALRRRHVVVLRVLLSLSLLPWLLFLLEMSKSALVSLAEYPSLTPALFVRVAAPSILLTLALWVLALFCARHFPMWVTGLPLTASILAVFGTLSSVRAIAFVLTVGREPGSGFNFDGLHGLWLFIYSCAAWLGLVMFAGSVHKLRTNETGNIEVSRSPKKL